LNGGNVLGRWTHTTAGGSDVTVQAYYDRTHLAQPADAVPADPPYESGFPASALVDNLGTYDVDLQSHFRLGEQQRLVWGLGYRYTHEVDFDLGIIQFVPGTLDQSLYSAFVQDDIALTPTMAITAGSKLEHNSYTGVEVEPSGRWQWNFDPKQMLWVAVSRAVRAPSRYDRDLEVLTGLENPPYPYRFPRTFLAGDPDFVSETLVAYELGYRAVLAQRLSGSVSTFYNDYDSLRGTAAAVPTATAPFPYPVTFDNDLAGDTYGAEFTLSYQALDWWRLHAGYDLLLENLYSKPGHPDATGALNETADPKHQVFLRSTAELPRGLELDAALRWISALTLDSSPTNGPVAGTVPSYWELDAHLAWQATRNLELSLVGQNLLHRDHAEYGFPGPTREEIPRDFYVRAELRY
jgi:iron complex outermembrane receptor protein